MKIKKDETKIRNTIAKQSQLSSLNSSMIKIMKQDSKHTKLSTNLTSSSLHQNAQSKKPTKQKSQAIQTSDKKDKTLRQKDKTIRQKDKTIRQKQKSSLSKLKKYKQKIKNKRSCDFQRQRILQFPQNGIVSYRQYCLVENSFLPIKSQNQQKQLEDIMRSTADTTHRFQDFNRATFRKVFPFKLKDNNQSISDNSDDSRVLFKQSKKVSKHQVCIEAVPFYQQVGIQYSQRPQLNSIQNKSIQQKQNQIISQQVVLKKPQKIQKNCVQIDIQTDQAQRGSFQSPVKFLTNLSPKKFTDQQSLSDLLLKLQFKHLPNDKTFMALSRNQKQHYSQLLHSLISKLNCSPRQTLSPSKSSKQSQKSHHFKSKQQIQIEQVNFVPLQQIKIKYEKLQLQIYKRQSYQMNWTEFRNGPQAKNNSIDTSLMSISSFLLNFFCFIELNYLQSFLTNIQTKYGAPYYAQYVKIVNKNTSDEQIYYNKDSFQVLDVEIFQQFCNMLNQISQTQKIHLRALFDHINSLINCYRPFYQHRGEPFPWAVKIYNNICEYVIDQSSFQIIFVQIKETIQKNVSLLCGILIEEKFYKDIQQINPLSVKRSQRQNLLVQSWLNEKTDQNHMIQCQATKTLFDLGQLIYKQLILQIINEKPLNLSLI